MSAFAPEAVTLQHSNGKIIRLRKIVYDDLSYYVDNTNNLIYHPEDGEEPIGIWDIKNNKPIDPLGDIKAFMIDYETQLISEQMDKLDEMEEMEQY